jgi:hypothetical protein
MPARMIARHEHAISGLRDYFRPERNDSPDGQIAQPLSFEGEPDGPAQIIHILCRHSVIDLSGHQVSKKIPAVSRVLKRLRLPI